MFNIDKNWIVIARPAITELPRALFVRTDHLPAKSYFPVHSHNWDQLTYAHSGVITVNVNSNSYVIPPEQAVWLPAQQEHSTYSLSGAEFCSLYINPLLSQQLNLSGDCRVISISALVRELIIRVSELPTNYDENGYDNQIIIVTLSEISRMKEIGYSLPWPKSSKLLKLCEELYFNPTDSRTIEQWGDELGASSRTLARHLKKETGLSFRHWRHRLIFFKALEYLGDGVNVTGVGLMLGYSSTSAFIHMFKKEYGCTPLKFSRQIGEGRPRHHKKF